MNNSTDGSPDFEVVIVGAGFSGIGAGIALDRAGFADFAILEDGDGVGGAWHWNTYPGVGVDIPSFSYQFSFHQRTDWSMVYAPGRELKEYAEDCVDTFGLRDRIRLNTRVTGTVFDDETHTWTVSTASGESFLARYVIDATGVLTQPKMPDIAGVETFAGSTLHTARWDHSADLTGKRVAVIGTGASAVQLIPAIAATVDQLMVFQRTPIWCLPKPDSPVGRGFAAALQYVPGVEKATRVASQTFVEVTFPLQGHYANIFKPHLFVSWAGKAWLRSQVKNPEIRAKLTPSYSPGCKRPSFHNKYLATFNRHNVQLETTSIAEITSTGIRTVDGTLHEVDVLVLATGFKVFEPDNMPPYPVIGTDPLDLGTWWIQNRYQAYEGASVPGFPNYFLVFGPYGYNGSSYFTLIENQSRHIVRALERARSIGATKVEVSAEANKRYFDQMLGRRGRQVFFRGSCAGANSYYFDSHGDVPLRPSPTLEAAWHADHYDLNDYHFTESHRVEALDAH
ncbi:MAG: NAD(P)/FAD-dependent oxidoreductase [Mycolicibacterium fortuitum]|uniref:flavin-containing monooxygenase n=1 Tax=Mycolicibacterium fortuitum TaxID=1766 RepID=UPI0022BA4945|nr:NAD(P)/FAD-dependent oxidoreductase [Mycolicibacterium fortuitum]WAY19772.1 NAD(P)/FAD-dependent oxidoreductase [Mycolicibacterium fortuitum]